MRILDTIKISQSNLLRAKLRTFLTVTAVVIGAFTLSLTNGIGSGIKAYVNEQLGNVGAKHTLVVQPKQDFNPLSEEVQKYDPDKKTRGDFDVAVLGENDIEKIKEVAGVVQVTPQYSIRIEYITTGDDKYEANASQYIEGLTLAMSAGTTVLSESTNGVTIPTKYLQPLGFASDQEALGKPLTIGFKNAAGRMVEKQLNIDGVQKQSLLGNAEMNISGALAREINTIQTAGISALSGSYLSAIAKHDPNLDEAQIADLKQRLDVAGYNARTIEEQIGTVATVINTILIVLNVFGVIALLAAAFGIVNTLLMSVNERTSEIGLMKALGAKRRTIFSIFAFEAASIGFWGALLGVIASMIAGSIISDMATKSFLKDFTGFQLVAFPLLPSLAVLFGIVALALLAGTLPSLKASKLDPIKALRYE